MLSALASASAPLLLQWRAGEEKTGSKARLHLTVPLPSC